MDLLFAPELCETVCPMVLEVGSGARGTDLPYSDIDPLPLLGVSARVFGSKFAIATPQGTCQVLQGLSLPL